MTGVLTAKKIICISSIQLLSIVTAFILTTTTAFVLPLPVGRSKTTQLTMTSDTVSKSDHILFDMPVSNNGARCRIILYKKNIDQDQVDIISPLTLGGLKSPDYLALSPNGLMPSLVIQKNHPSGMKHIAESDTIARYLLSEYANVGPSFLRDNPRSNQIVRWHDMYLTTIQGCLVSRYSIRR